MRSALGVLMGHEHASGQSATSTGLRQIADVIGCGIRVGDHVVAYFRYWDGPVIVLFSSTTFFIVNRTDEDQTAYGLIFKPKQNVKYGTHLLIYGVLRSGAGRSKRL